MKTPFFLLFALTIAILQLGCEDKIGSSQETVQATIDLQGGFSGNWVGITINSELKFGAGLSSQVSFSGPEASFTTNLLRGFNTLEAQWYPLDESATPIEDDTTLLILGDSEKYYIGIGIAADSIQVIVQDSPFLYAR